MVDIDADDHRGWEDEPHPLERLSWWSAGATLTLIIAGLIWLWPTDTIPSGSRFFADDVLPAEVREVSTGPCKNVPELECTRVTMEIKGGTAAGDEFRQDFFGDLTDPRLEVGDAVVVNYLSDADAGFRYQYADRQRRPAIWWLAGLFALAVIALGRWRGVMALVSLAASFGVILAFVLPALLVGKPAVPVALVGAAAVAYLTLYLAHGVNIRTTVALLGSLFSLLLVGLLAWLSVKGAEITGLATEEALFLPLLNVTLDFPGLVLAAIVLGSMGALDDVTITQAEAIHEISTANPALGRRELFEAGLRIGRAHIGSTVNTLALAYAGAALPLLLLFLVADQSLGTVANSEVVATELIRTLAGSIGLVSSVPLTTWLASTIIGWRPSEAGTDRQDS